MALINFRIIKNDETTFVRIGLYASVPAIFLFSLVHFVKGHRIVRYVVGIIGIALSVWGVFWMLSPRGAAASQPPSSLFLNLLRLVEEHGLPLVLLGLLLLVMFLFSDSYFQFVLENNRPAIAKEETEKAEKNYEENSKDPFAYLELDTKKLSEYYNIDQRQARSSYRWAIAAMIIGLSVIVIAVLEFFNVFGQNDQNRITTSALSAVAGIVINVVSALFIQFHHRAQNRSLIHFNQLVRNQQLGLSIRLALEMNDPELEKKQKAKIIDNLLEVFKVETGKIFFGGATKTTTERKSRSTQNPPNRIQRGTTGNTI